MITVVGEALIDAHLDGRSTHTYPGGESSAHDHGRRWQRRLSRQHRLKSWNKIAADDAFTAGLIAWLWQHCGLEPATVRSLDPELGVAPSRLRMPRVARSACARRPGCQQPRMSTVSPIGRGSVDTVKRG
jgi:hypothetical protein